MSIKKDIVENIRSDSRNLVRQLGFTGDRFAETDLPPSAVHTLIEIERNNLTAKDLSQILLLEKSSVSRMLKKLTSQGLIIGTADSEDSRVKKLSLTTDGKKRVNKIHEYARNQVNNALSKLNRSQQQTIQNGLHLYSNALSNTEASPKKNVRITTGYTPAIIGNITQLHSTYYSRETRFGVKFEAVVASGLSDFCCRLENPVNQIWTATIDGEMVGSIAIDGEDLGNNIAHLRWFIVSDKARGTGIGKQLLKSALDFVDTLDFTETHLWTFAGLNAAKHLYESNGFVLNEESLGEQWGKEVLEQCFIRSKQ